MSTLHLLEIDHADPFDSIKQNGMMSRIANITILLLLVSTISACSSTMRWKEEVQLHDGHVLVVERSYSLGGHPTLDARERQALDQTLTFTAPESNKRISWKTEYRQDLPEPNSLGPLLLDIVGGIPYLATSPAGCIAYNKWGRPNPPYVLFKYANDVWQQIPMKEFPAELVGSNLMSRPASSLLKSYYTVEAARAQRNDGNVSEYAKTIFHEPIRSAGQGCGELIYDGRGGWQGPGLFSRQPSKEACFKYCKQREITAQYCPCSRFFK